MWWLGRRFIRDEGDNAAGGWEVELAQKYYRKLFKEYAVGDLSRYKVGAAHCNTQSNTHLISVPWSTALRLRLMGAQLQPRRDWSSSQTMG